jgi:hypothetical protein
MLSPLCLGTSRHGRASRATLVEFFCISFSFLHGKCMKMIAFFSWGRSLKIHTKMKRESSPDKEHKRTIGGIRRNLLTTLIKKWGQAESAP